MLMNNPISRVITRADLVELPKLACLSSPLVPHRWGIRGGRRIPRRPRRIEHMDRLPLCGRALCERELQRVHRAPRGEAEQLAYLVVEHRPEENTYPGGRALDEVAGRGVGVEGARGCDEEGACIRCRARLGGQAGRRAHLIEGRGEAGGDGGDARP